MNLVVLRVSCTCEEEGEQLPQPNFDFDAIDEPDGDNANAGDGLGAGGLDVGGLGADGDDPGDAGDPYEVDMSKAVYIAGPHHMIHNLQNDFPSVMSLWVWFINFLKHVCRLLSNKWSKDRLLRRCFSAGPSQLYYSDISSFSSLVYDARWGTAAAAINNLIPIADGLKLYWNKALFTLGRRVEEDASGKGCDADTVDNAIRIQTRQ